MSLFFLHPAHLYGLIAASLPIIIHLLNRRRLKRIRFPAVRFILLAQRRISRTYRLRHWIILALRTCAILFLVLLLAHPIFQTGMGLFAGGGLTSAVVILDNSLSMKWSGGGEGFKKAREAARQLISSLKETDRLAVIPASTAGRSQMRPVGEQESLLRELEAIGIAAGTADFARALSRAYELLSKETATQKQIWFITDMALADWDRFSLSALGQYDPLIPLKILKVGKGTEPLNATIKEIRTRGEGVGVGLPVDLEASIINFGDKEIRDLLIELHLDGQKKDQRLVSVSPRRELGVSFQFQLAQAGSHYGQVILKKQGLAGNATAYFTLQALDQFKVLVVDGDPKTSLVQSEAFFLTRALNPSGTRASSQFLPTVIIPEGLGSVTLDSYDAIVFCNLPLIPDALLPKLRNYLRQGGGLLLFLGDRVQADDYNLKLFDSSPPILPARIREKRTLTEPQEEIQKVDTGHAALQGLADELLKKSLLSAEIKSYFRAESAGAPPLLSLANGDPLLLEKKIGPGRVLLFTTAADRDWSNLPLKTAYLPLMQSLVSYIAGGKRGSMDPGIDVGTPKVLSFPASAVGKRVKITKPDGKEREAAIAAKDEKAVGSFEENDLAGIYRFYLPAGDGREATQFYPVNSPFLESRLETIGDKELQAKLSPIRAEVIPIESLEKGGKRVDLSLPLLGLLLMTLASVGWLAQRMDQ